VRALSVPSSSIGRPTWPGTSLRVHGIRRSRRIASPRKRATADHDHDRMFEPHVYPLLFSRKKRGKESSAAELYTTAGISRQHANMRARLRGTVPFFPLQRSCAARRFLDLHHAVTYCSYSFL
jgi:hypothetical protein